MSFLTALQARNMKKCLGVVLVSLCLGVPVASWAQSSEKSQPEAESVPLEKEALEGALGKRQIIPFQDGMILPILIAERAVLNQDYQTAFQIYWQLAKDIKHPQFAEQAARILVTAQAQQPQTGSPKQYQALKEAAIYWFDLDGTSIQAFGLMIDAHLLTGEIQSLPAILKSAIDRHPKLTEKYWISVRERFKNIQQGAIMRALVLIGDLAKISPDHPQARLAVAETALRAGKYDLAIQEAQKAAKLRPDWDAPILLQAELLIGQDKAEEAIPLLKNFAEENPQQAKLASLLLGDVFLGKGNFPAAYAVYGQLADQNADDGELLMQAGQLAIKVENYETAKGYLRKALNTNISDEAKDQARFWLVQIASTLKQFDDAALTDIEKISDSKIQQITLFSYALELYRAGKTEPANLLVQRFYYKHQNTAEDRLEYGFGLLTYYRQTDQKDKAKYMLEQLLAKNPNNPYLLYDAGMMADQEGNFAKFESIFKRIIRLAPDYAHAYNALGYSYADRGIKLKEARKLLEKAINLSPNDPFIQDSMGWLEFKEKNYQKAVEWLSKSLNTRSEVEVMAHLGEVYWTMGNREKALEIWQEGLTIDPNHEVLLKTILRLNGKPL